ncbi:litaf-like zinc finger domain-containing [Fusarium albosuccineum]|uniref:Litaf-like zinc finger domain-containing n=1 Tax=Fusarium albosuccineum TaxID=1237068 RepID=A0A8H4L4M5_9HYPO|nr:litaf-like zinc finger domain-containing [Fusarium albosuccineum]
MEKPTPPQNHPAVVSQQPPEVSREQAPPNYENREFSSPLAQPPLTNPSSPPPTHQYGGSYQQDPNGFPPQTHAPQQQGLSSIPIQNLQSQSAPVVCPSCNARAMTVTTPESGGLTHAIAAAVCLVSCLGCIPYCISSLKDVHHKCGNCGIPLADFHRSGRTEVLGWQK